MKSQVLLASAAIIMVFLSPVTGQQCLVHDSPFVVKCTAKQSPDAGTEQYKHWVLQRPIQLLKETNLSLQYKLF